MKLHVRGHPRPDGQEELHGADAGDGYKVLARLVAQTMEDVWK